MAKTKMKSRRHTPPGRAVQAPRKREAQRRAPSWSYAVGALLLVAAIVSGVFLLARDKGQPGSEAPASSTGLPDTPDYHSLLVAPSDPAHILLGTHAGLYESRDGGRHWTELALADQDAMNLAPGSGGTVWTAGHDVFAKSTDGGTTWSDVRPPGLPSLDIHGFAVDPTKPQRLYAAVAGKGLYRSADGGRSFTRVSAEVGGAVMALAITPDGRIFAGDMEQGLLASSDGGTSWRVVLRAPVVGLAVNPADSNTIVAGGPGILLSTDGGGKWREVRAVGQGVGPVAWSQSEPDVGYAVGFDRLLYRTGDRGDTWQPVG